MDTVKQMIPCIFLISKYKALYKNLDKSICFFIFLLSVSCHAATQEQLSAVAQAAETHVKSIIDVPYNGELIVKSNGLDSRLKLTTCPSPLLTSSPSKNRTSNNVTVLVECPEHDWKVYVPVRVTMTLPFVTAAYPLTKGEIVSQHDVSIKMIQLSGYRRQGFTSLSQVVGTKLKRNIRAGKVIERKDICVVCRNEQVVIRAIKNEMQITTKGTALTDGTMGEEVRVKNNRSKKIITGVVTGIAEITVYF